MHADQFRAQLYHLPDDPAETKDVSAEHPEVVKGLSALLDLYRDGGYSRELPPVMVKKEAAITELPAVSGETVLAAALDAMPAKPWTALRGQWTAQEGGLWGVQKGAADQGATLRVPVDVTDGVIEYRIQFRGANRHSLRIEAGEKRGSFRIEISRSYAGITKNPDPGADTSTTELLARKNLSLKAGVWYPVRISFKGSTATLQVNDNTLTATHPILAEKKSALNFLVFGESAGFQQLKIIR